MLDNLSGRLAGVVKSLRGQARITEANVQDTLRQVRLALLEADVALPGVKDFIEAVKTRALGQEGIASLSPADVSRPAAIDQLRQLTAQLDVSFFEAGDARDPLKFAQAAQDHARRQFYYVLILDN